MKVLVHYPSMTDSPVGVWWLPRDADWPQDYYLDPNSPDAVRGRQTMASKRAGVSWPDFWESLTERAPYFSAWNTADVSDTWTPQEYLGVLQRAAA